MPNIRPIRDLRNTLEIGAVSVFNDFGGYLLTRIHIINTDRQIAV